jgi:hypothetical protein
MGDHWRIAPRLCMAWSGRRFASHRPVWGLLAGYSPWGPRLLLKELDGDPRRIGRVGACWRGTARGRSRLLMAEAWFRCRSSSRAARGRPRLLMAEAWSPVQIQLSRGRLLLAGACPWDVSPPAGGGLSPVQPHLAAKKYLLERQLWYSVLI